MRVSLIYLGCRTNQAEIAEMETELRKGGHEIVSLDESPETCIINTCTVTKKSDDQSRQLIRKAARTGARVIVTGCYAELNPSDAGALAGKGAVVQNTEKHYIINQFIGISSSSDSYNVTETPSRSKYFLKVQDGCDNRCTYCSVWKARGKSRSILIEDAVRMAQKAEASGYMEIDLTGIHLGMYGRDIVGFRGGVGALLEKLLHKTRKCRFRLSSLEVNEVDEGIVDLMTETRVCRHLHIPLQSGDERVLADMGRGYSPEQYNNKINWIHGKLGDIGLGTDIIAGFPTESAASFRNTVGIINELPLTYLHVFPYSKRPGTSAVSLEDIVGDEERKKRAQELREMGSIKKTRYMKMNMGSDLEVLLEKYTESEGWTGTSDNYLKVKGISVPDGNDSGSNKGRLLRIEVNGMGKASLRGKLKAATGENSNQQE